jgi:predicted outer membrane repeat protein
MFNNTSLAVNSLGLVTPEANRLVSSPSPLQLNSGSSRSIAFVDAGLSDVKTLTAGLQADTTVYLLDSTGDELSQITAVLAGYRDLASVTILSHGRSGGLQLGSSWLDSNSLMGQAGQVRSWAGALGKGADLLLYGCDVAADAIGQGFVQQLATLTGADVAASSNLTGSAALGGDWVLEYQTGAIEAAALVVANYASVLATFNVTNKNDAGAGSLRDAISKANAAPGADTINFTGSIFKDAIPDQITLTTGALSISSDITIKGTGASKLSISGNNASRVFEIANASNVTISGLLITQGLADGAAGGGGGIFNSGTLTLKNSTVSSNTSFTSAGGILNSGTLTLNNSTVSSNAGSFGGGIVSNGTLTLSNSTVSGNTAGTQGGGIFYEGTLTLSNSTISGNTATDGGGIFNVGTLALKNSIISGNKATGAGGGIYNFMGTFGLISGTTITGNQAPTGANIYSA